MLNLRSSGIGVIVLIVSAALSIDVLLYSEYSMAHGVDQLSKTYYYGCRSEVKRIACNNSSHLLESYSARADWTKVYQVTSEAKFAQGKFDMGLEMDETYSESTVLSESPIQNTVFSISLWINPSTSADHSGHIISNVQDSAKSGWYLQMSPSEEETGQAVSFGIFDNAGVLHDSDKISVMPNKFTHIAVSFDGSAIKVFRDGNALSETRLNGVYNLKNETSALKVGAGSYCNTCLLWSGVVDDLRIYGNVLAEDEIKSIHSGKAADYFSNSLLGYWPFDNNLQDVTGKASDAYIVSLVSSMVFSPDNRLFFSEKNTGKIKIMKDDKVLDNPFVQISDHYIDWEQGLLGLTIDPKFEQNHFVYLYYTYLDANSGIPYNRVVRFTDTNNTATDMVILLNNITASKGFHSGGALAFGPDDKLYITVGDATNHTEAQNSTSLLGKILRINRDGTIPDDNPFPDSPVYTLGHRNMYGIAFDNDTGLGIVTENGDALYDEINLIQKSGNYGFPTFQPANVSPELANSSDSILPLRSYSPVIVPTQAIHYEGNKIKEFKDNYLFGSFNGRIYSLDIDKNSGKITELKAELDLSPFEGITAIAQSPKGDIYFGGYSIFLLRSLHTIEQEVFPFEIVSPNSMWPTSMHLSASRNGATMDISFDYRNHSAATSSSTDSISVRAPESLFQGVKAAVLSIASDKEIEPDIEINKASNSDYITVVIPLKGSRPLELLISADL
jgi:glucose/arabinose dehydrogenase